MADSGGAAGAQDRGGGELGGPGEGGGRHHDGREDAHARGAGEDAVGGAEPEHGDGEGRDGARAIAVVSLAGGLGHGAAHATGRWICDPWGPCHPSPSRSSTGIQVASYDGTRTPLTIAGGNLAACRWPPLPSARARIQDHHDGPWPHARTRPARPERPSARRRVCPSRQAAPLPATPSPVGMDRLRRALHHAAGPRAVLPVRRDRALRRQTATVGPQGWPAQVHLAHRGRHVPHATRGPAVPLLPRVDARLRDRPRGEAPSR